ncbi:MAG: hypothetical protein JRD92_07940 [Deltaproteobacteria bacterium]|nr:hypothetical protein [Deltaproteobacteria bacterium]MBW2586858.1 hypothetical protein [Deltaproteobacteria bacterium]
MTRSACLIFLAFALPVGACSSTANQVDPDGGMPDPDGGIPVTGECRLEGYPCSPADVTPEARALSHQYVGEVQERLAAGESFDDVAAWLKTQEDVAHVVGDSNAIRFRVTGGSAQWFYDPGPGIARENPAELTAKSGASGPVPKRVLREDDSETKIKKKALIIEPFEEFIVTPVATWQNELSKLHDYETVDHLTNRDVLDEHFGNWNDYRFIWVTTHGKHLPTDNPTYSALFSGRMCEESGWLRNEIVELGNGDELTGGDTTTLRALFGRPRPFVVASITPAQKERLDAYENAEVADLDSDGVFCGNLKMAWIPVPGFMPGDGVLTDVTIKYWGYDEIWHQDKYPSGLKNAFLYLRACTSHTVPLDIGSGARGAILGWSDVINSADDNQTIGVLFDRLIIKGETLEDALKDVREANLDEFTRGDKNPKLTIVSKGNGEEKIRVREIISIIDPNGLVPFPDEGGMLEAREITPEGNTVVDVTVEIVGFAEVEAKEFKVQIFDGNGGPISREFEVDDPILGGTVMTIPVSFNQEIRSPTEVEIEARVTLPEESGTVYSRHPIKLTVGPAIESLWTLTVGGAGTARGDFVFAPFPMGITDGEGRLVWQVTLAQFDEFSVPMATLLIVGHNGRTLECTGATGSFEALVLVQYTDDPMPTEGFGGGLGEGECGDFVNVEIVSFSREDDLVANVSGTICHVERVGNETRVTPVPINGRFQMPSAGCGMDPGGDLVGSFYATEAPSLCTDIYPNAAIAPAFDEVCSAGGGVVCSEDPCSTAGQIGQCDFRAAAVQISFRGQIQHFGAGGDWPSLGELQGACEIQLGTWTTGAPMP